MQITRRRFAKQLATAGAVLAFERWASAQVLPALRSGRLVRTMPLGRFDGRPAPPLDALLGTGLDARQFTDLSSLEAGHLVTQTDRFYVRTTRPPMLPQSDSWTIALGGLVDQERAIDLRTLERDARDQGVCLMECSGNSDPANFGLLSAASWSGVSMGSALTHVAKRPGATRVRVTGVDDERTASMTSYPGASWVFTQDELERTGAFLALRMNEAALSADHGAPVRLVVPNYYGCCCIKWVSRIDWVADDEPSTSQMMEFSARTHQVGIPPLARTYEPPVIDLAAMPIRVEQWTVDRNGKSLVLYRVVGIRWGGAVRTAPLLIRFSSNDRFVPVSDNPSTDNPRAWSLWSHEWTPSTPGRYQIALSVGDRSIRTRRLDLYFYTRDVEIDRV